jgi:hypothetical protein
MQASLRRAVTCQETLIPGLLPAMKLLPCISPAM